MPQRKPLRKYQQTLKPERHFGGTKLTLATDRVTVKPWHPDNASFRKAPTHWACYLVTYSSQWKGTLRIS
jgi:hypothetical protein